MPIKKFHEDYQPVLQKLAKERNYYQIRLGKELSGYSGAHTYLVYPETSLGCANPLVLKVGKKSILEKDFRGLELAKNFVTVQPPLCS
jgi:hypothetical protein